MTTVTGNQHLVKQINKTLVLKKVMNEAPLSRAIIAQQLGLNKGTVSSLVSELIDEHFVFETGPGKSSGGRRPVMLIFNEKAGYSIGIDLGVNYILSVLTDLKGNIVKEINQKLSDRSETEVLRLLKQSIEDLMKSAPESPYGVIGIGIGVPGIVNNDGEILIAPNLGWKNVPLKEEIETAFNIPVIIENEANAGAYGEKLYGSGKNYNNMIYVSAGIGIGVGIILGGELFTGTHGFSGEMGHSIIVVNGKKCSCGNKGCWEIYASEKALLEEASQMDLMDEDQLSIEALVQLAENNNQDVISIFNKIGMYLGVGINNIINTFNPEQVIIGNRLEIARQWLEEPIKEFIKTNTTQFLQEDLSIKFSVLKNHSTARGVSALTIGNFLKKVI